MFEENEPNELESDITVESETGENFNHEETDEIEVQAEDKVKQLKKQLQSCAEERKNVSEELQRAKADFLNSKKRLEEERARDQERATSKHILRLLPLCDSFRSATSNTELWQSAPEEWRAGVEAIHAQLQKILTDAEVSIIDPSGTSFDPEKHEAVGSKDSEEDAGIVLEVLALGYERKNEIIRPASVVISN